jgi:asparagine synthase (glutamine-hydrolysing)
VVTLLHTRLAIIDLSEAGAQPMRDPATGNVITFNGEIYNFRSLRDELTEPDEPWQSHSDTEVILRAWRRWGLDCLTRLRGMYAFALWDAASRKLFLARDPFGIKPLYWARRGRTVGFASEIRAILAMGIVDGRVDPARVAEFLRWQSAVGQGAIVEGVEMVEPGGVVVVREDGEVSTRNAERGARNGSGGGALRRAGVWPRIRQVKAERTSEFSEICGMSGELGVSSQRSNRMRVSKSRNEGRAGCFRHLGNGA